jgi:hypothetical protein
LTGVHDAGGHNYLVKEPFEELLWWLQFPALLKLAGEASPDRASATAIVRAVADTIAAVEAAGYQADRLVSFDRRNRKVDPAKESRESGPLPSTANKSAPPHSPQQQPRDQHLPATGSSEQASETPQSNARQPLERGVPTDSKPASKRNE